MSIMKPIVPVKVTQPGAQGVLPRERLFDSIRKGCEKKIVWISAPAGSGKTTLAANYLEIQNIPSLWYQVDSGDDDLATFFYYFGLAAQKIRPHYRKPLPFFTSEYLLSIPIFAKRYFEELSRRLTGKTRSNSKGVKRTPVLVFDDYQDIDENSLFHAVVSAGLEVIPPEMNVFILSRNAAPPAFAGLEGAAQIHLIDWEDIRLDRDESCAIAMSKAGRELPEMILNRLYETTDGWAAGIVLLLERLRISGYTYQIPVDLPRNEIFDYYASEMFDSRSMEERMFLMKTAFLPAMNIQMAKQLTGNIRASRIFADLSHKNYFTARYDSRQQLFRYHPLFREFLQTKAADALPSHRLQEIKHRAARVLEVNGHSEDAVPLFCKAESWADAGRLILFLANPIILQGRWQTLWGWISGLPDAVTSLHPWLIYWKGISMLHACPPESLAIFEAAYEKFDSGENATGAFMSLSGMFEAIGHTFDSFTAYDRLIQMMIALIEKYPKFQSLQIEARVVHSMLWALMLRQPQPSLLTYWEDRGLSIVRKIREKDTALSILLALVYIPMFSGDLERVKQITESFKDKFISGQNSPLTALMLNNFYGNYYWLAADFEKTFSAVADGIRLAEQTGIHFFDAPLQGHGAACALSLGDTQKAGGYLKKMQAALHILPSVWIESYYHCLEAWKCLIEGHLSRSALHSDLAVQFIDQSGSLLTKTLMHLSKAMALHGLKRNREAIEHLAEIWKICNQFDMFQIEFLAYLLEAQIAFDCGNDDSGTDLLQKGMAIGCKYNYASTFFWVDAAMVKLCARALEAEIETDYVQSLIRKRRLTPDIQIQSLENWPWSLRVYTLGSFDMMRNGMPLRFSGKVQQKPILLLKALIGHGGRNVREEQLCEAIWPDADGDMAHRCFETTLYRLRRMIGVDNTFHFNEGRLTLDRQSCWVDVFALEQILVESDNFCEPSIMNNTRFQPSPDTITKVHHLTQKAIHLYKGHFFDSEPEHDWLVTTKIQLKSKYIRAIESLAGFWELAGNEEMAIKCYEKALETDELLEEIYQRLMVIYLRNEQRAKALNIYHQCRIVFKNRLGIAPSGKTEAILGSIGFSSG